MKLKAPKLVTFWVAIIIGIVGFASNLGMIPALSEMALLIVMLGFALLLAGNVLTDL